MFSNVALLRNTLPRLPFFATLVNFFTSSLYCFLITEWGIIYLHTLIDIFSSPAPAICLIDLGCYLGLAHPNPWTPEAFSLNTKRKNTYISSACTSYIQREEDIKKKQITRANHTFVNIISKEHFTPNPNPTKLEEKNVRPLPHRDLPRWT